MQGDEQPLAALLTLSLSRRQERLAGRVAAHLSALGDSEESLSIGRMVAQSRGASAAVLKTASQLEPLLVEVIEEGANGAESAPVPLEEELPLKLALAEIAATWEPMARHVALALDPDLESTRVEIPDEDRALMLRMSQLGASPLFDQMSLEALADLGAVAVPHEYAPGELICTRGTPSEGVLLVVAGSAHITIKNATGTTSGLVEAGQTIGELGAMTGATWNDMAVATRHGTSVLCLPIEKFRELLDQDAHAATGMLRLISERLRERRTSGARSVVPGLDDGVSPN